MNGTAWFIVSYMQQKHNISQTATRVYYNRVFRYYYSVWGGACTQGKVFQHDLCCEVKYDVG